MKSRILTCIVRIGGVMGPRNVALSATGSSGGGMCVKKGGQCYRGHSC
jgi:hypothetical protein